MSFEITPLQGVEQAQQVRQLFLDVYGADYPISLYYEPENLWAAHQSGQTVCAVAVSEGSVVGHCALYASAPNPRLLEVGAGLVNQSVRGGGAITSLVQRLVALARERNLADWIFGEAVCNHTGTQKVLARAGFVETALEVDLMPASAYKKEASAESRVSTLLSFLPIQDSACQISPPTRYSDTLLHLYEGFDIQRESLDGSAVAPTALSTTAKPTRIELAELLRLQIVKVGQDFGEHLKERSPVFQLMLPLDSEHLDFAVRESRKAGFFFSGLLPVWTGVDNILLQRLESAPVWDSIALFSRRSQSLMELLRVDAPSPKALPAIAPVTQETG